MRYLHGDHTIANEHKIYEHEVSIRFTEATIFVMVINYSALNNVLTRLKKRNAKKIEVYTVGNNKVKLFYVILHS